MTQSTASTAGAAPASTTTRKPVKFKPAQARRAFDEIIDQIRALIQAGELRPGDRLPSERTLADQFAVSRNTVREALRMLEIAGLVTLKRGATGGSFIAGGDPMVVASSLSDALHLTDISLADVTETLQGISSMAATIACERMTDEDLENMRRNLNRATEMTQAKEWEDKVEVHLEFHVLLAEATGNPLLVLIMRSLTDVVGKVVHQVGATQDDSILRYRRALIRALEARDPDAATKALGKYFDRLHRMWLAGDYDGARREVAKA